MSKESLHGTRLMLINLAGTGILAALNLGLPFLVSLDDYSQFVINYSLYIVSSNLFNFGLGSITLKYAVKNLYNLENYLFVIWLILLLICIPLGVVITWFFAEVQISDFLASGHVILAGALTGLLRNYSYLYLGKRDLRKYALSYLSPRVVLFSGILLTFLLGHDMNVVYRNTFICISASNLLILLLTGQVGFAVKYDILLRLARENSHLLLMNTFNSLLSGYGITLVFSSVLVPIELAVMNVSNQIISGSSQLSNSYIDAYLPSFLSKKISRSSVRKFNSYLSIKVLVIGIMSVILGSLWIKYAFELSKVSLLGFIIGTSVVFANPFKSVGFNVIIDSARNHLISISYLTYTVLIPTTAYFGFYYFGFIGLNLALFISTIVHLNLINMFSRRFYNV